MASKRQRFDADIGILQRFLHIGGISNSGLKKVFEEIRSLPEIPEVVNKRLLDASFMPGLTR